MRIGVAGPELSSTVRPLGLCLFRLMDTNRYCKGCGYCLNELGGPTCPECGRSFDPADPRTFVRRTPGSNAQKYVGVFTSVLVGSTLLWILIGFGGLFSLLLITPVVLAVAIAALGRRRAHWKLWESVLLVCPFYAWFALSFAFPSAKSLSNLFVEALIIAWLVPVAVLSRVVLGREQSTGVITLSVVVAVILAVASVFALVPPLPE